MVFMNVNVSMLNTAREVLKEQLHKKPDQDPDSGLQFVGSVQFRKKVCESNGQKETAAESQ
jgi:hypothetical protein